jgi:hypothetical protein
LEKEQLDLLAKKILKLVAFYDFVQRVSREFFALFDKLIGMDPKTAIISDTLLFEVFRALDKLVILNEIKNRKESPNNEISHFKRLQIQDEA